MGSKPKISLIIYLWLCLSLDQSPTTRLANCTHEFFKKWPFGHFLMKNSVPRHSPKDEGWTYTNTKTI